MNPIYQQRLFVFFCIFLNAIALYAQEKAVMKPGRQEISINDQWYFVNDSIASLHPSESAWQKVSIPHTWNNLDVLDDTPGYYRGTGQYKRKINVHNFKGKHIYLRFKGVGQECQVYVNGKFAGSHLGGYNRFVVPITSFLNFTGENEVLVKASNKFNIDLPPLTGDFTQFGGVYRGVDMIVTSPVHFSQSDYGSSGIYIMANKVAAEAANVQVKALLENNAASNIQLKVRFIVKDAGGATIGEKIATQQLQPNEQKTVISDLPVIRSPELWSPERPYLYTVTAQIINDQQVIDQIVQPLGLRWFTFDANQGFFLNGKPLKLIGASRHQDYAGLGNAVPEVLQIRDVELLKAMGGNFLRVAHYPQDQSVLDACDRLGILTSVETPIVNRITVSGAFTANAIHMQKEMIRQNYNHPSVVLWAYMNEVLLQPLYAGDAAKQEEYFAAIKTLAQKLEALTRAEDPSRYTMMANHGAFDSYNKLGLTQIPMVVGWNLYSGWYGGVLADFAKFLDRHHKELPDKPILVTEYGADADPRVRSSAPLKFDKSIEYALKYHQVYLNEIISKPFVSGGIAWNLSDFSSEFRSETMPHINNKGLLTIDRTPKDTYWLYKSWLKKGETMVKIASAGWNYNAGIADSLKNESTQRIQVISNASEITLFLNGKQLGVQKTNDHIAVFSVPFIQGSNQLVATAGEATDVQEITFNVLPLAFKRNAFHDMNILLGTGRKYFDPLKKQVWVPAKMYSPGSWGWTGGNAYKIPNSLQPAGTNMNILGTGNDPVYQTQQEGIGQFRLDVPDGVYVLTLHFAELTGAAGRAVVNNLSNTAAAENAQQRIFDVAVNEVKLLPEFNIAGNYGLVTAVQKEFKISVQNGEGIVISFTPIVGKPILNALQLRKSY